ncbi:MAG: hypothetical protein KAR06_02195 [Deltaproteobacteria bacterium]|nr:hypothetical protein [Deltaproteobacteria bacterium]
MILQVNGNEISGLVGRELSEILGSEDFKALPSEDQKRVQDFLASTSEASKQMLEAEGPEPSS